MEQIDATHANLRKQAELRRIRNEFRNINLASSIAQPHIFSNCVKYKSIKFSNHIVSLIRLFGVQFCEDVVLIAGGGLKKTQDYQSDKLLYSEYLKTFQFDKLFNNHGLNYKYFQGFDTEPIEL